MATATNSSRPWCSLLCEDDIEEEEVDVDVFQCSGASEEDHGDGGGRRWFCSGRVFPGRRKGSGGADEGGEEGRVWGWMRC